MNVQNECDKKSLQVVYTLNKTAFYLHNNRCNGMRFYRGFVWLVNVFLLDNLNKLHTLVMGFSLGFGFVPIYIFTSLAICRKLSPYNWNIGISEQARNIRWYAHCDRLKLTPAERKNASLNQKRILDICLGLVEKYEKNNHEKSESCKSYIEKSLKETLDEYIEELAFYNDLETNYIEVAHAFLSHEAFDILAYGKTEEYNGFTDVEPCLSNVKIVFDNTMKYALNHNLLTKEEIEKEYQHLEEEQKRCLMR